MPAVGFVDPSYRERRQTKPGRVPHWFTADELLGRTSEASPKWSPWTFELVNAVTQEQYDPEDRISVTSLMGCVRAEVIKRKLDFIDFIDSRFLMLRGTMVHRTLERYARLGSIAEVRFVMTVDDIRISCVPDLVTEDTVFDYKVTDNPPSFGYPYRDHTEQLQLNRFILNNAETWNRPGADEQLPELPFDPREVEFSHLVAVYLGPKGPKPIEVEHKVKFITPAGVEKDRKEPHVWDDETVLKEFRPRITMLAEALRIFPEWPEDAEKLWGGLPGWKCPGPPVCWLPNCLAARYPDGLMWDNPEEDEK